jgi:hypothetical protein
LSKKSKHRKARGLAKKFPTLADMLRSFADGELTRAEFMEVIDAIEMGKGLAKRDRELAGFIEAAPERMEQDPMYVKGYNAGVLATLAEAEKLTTVEVTPETDVS